MNHALFIALIALLSACNAENPPPSPATDANNGQATSSNTPPASPVSPVSACDKLSLQEVISVYPDKTFKIETNRNDEPNIYQALSACRYQEQGKELYDQYFVDLEIRALPSAQQAIQMVQTAQESDLEHKGKDISGYGQKAYYLNLPMQSGGPQLVFAKDHVYYKLNVQTIHQGAFQTLEAEIMALANKIVE